MGNVVLIGFMGCGKSSVAVKLSYRLKRQMTDTDRLIEKKQGKSIREIFEQDGEEAFRLRRFFSSLRTIVFYSFPYLF